MNRRALIAALSAFPSARTYASETTFDLHGARVFLDAGKADADFETLLRNWIVKSSDAVVLYYGKFPVPTVSIRTILSEGNKVGGGTTYPGDIPHIDVRVGRNAREASLMQADWVMVHEMIHLAFPWMGGEHNWMAEGIAVYVESIARVQVGHLPPQQIWHDFVKQMPNGLPREGDGGYDITTDWGRTYWGGALFCLLADIRIRQETTNKAGLQQALKAINRTRDFRRNWDFRETLEIGDMATGTHALIKMYDEMKDKAVAPDLDNLWKDLGVSVSRTGAEFDATAPLASIRNAITKAQA